MTAPSDRARRWRECRPEGADKKMRSVSIGRLPEFRLSCPERRRAGSVQPVSRALKKSLHFFHSRMRD
jgi:hypothetical protein